MSKKTIILYFLSTFLIFGLIMLLPVPSSALQLTNTAVRTENHLAQVASRTAQRQMTTLEKLQAKGDEMITLRLASLQRLQTRIQNDTRLADSDKNAFLSDITSSENNLTALKQKIDADTSASTALVDVKTIVTAYRIYEYFEPRVRLLVIIDNLQTTTNSVSSFVIQVQQLLTTLQNEGINTTTAQNALSDISSQLTTIATTLSTDKTFLQNVSITSTNPQSIFTQVRKDLAGVRADMARMRADFATIRTSIHPTSTNNPSSSSSAQ